MSKDVYDPIPKKEPKKRAIKEISYFQIYRFATPFEIFLIFIAFLCAVIKTLAMPCVIIVYGEFVSLLVDRTYRLGRSTKTDLLPLFGGGKMLVNASLEENIQEIYNDSYAYGGLMALSSLAICLGGTISIDLFNYTALRQITRIRKYFFQAIITQDIAWHDVTRDQNFAVRITDDIEKIRDGISEKVSHFIYFLFGFATTFATSMAYGWKLTLAVYVYLPVVIVLNIVVSRYQSKYTTKEMSAYSIAGQIAEEVFSAIRTVVAFNGEKTESIRYENSLQPSVKSGKRKGIFTGVAEGVMRSLLFVSCAGAFWYGIHLVTEARNTDSREYNPGVLTIVFFAVFVGTDNISRLSPILEAFAKARGSATTIFDVINAVSQIDPLSKDGEIPPCPLKGNIEFEDIFFSYPSRDDVIVHRGLNVKVESGQTVALVGNSGCGKSSCIQLLQRFYDPIFGKVLIDGLDIRKYNLKWLRSNIAIVGQEPVLFSASIGRFFDVIDLAVFIRNIDIPAENIRYGKPGASQKEVEDAARASGAHSFICSLPDSYQTVLAENSTQLSGGQKQRIAIARALIQNPKILLLDEATSALDYQSEKLVQDALDGARKGRTTLVVSHRLSAINKADKIVFIENGRVLEEGTHDDLMKLDGKYAKMVSAGNKEEPDKIEDAEKLFLEDDTYRKSFETDVNNLQEYHENIPENRESLDMRNNSVPLLTIPKKIEEKDETDSIKGKYMKTFGRIVRACKPEWAHLIFGILLALIGGATYPAYAVLFGEFYAALAYVDFDEAMKQTRDLCIVCLSLGGIALIVGFIQTYLFNLASIYLSLRLRGKAFKSILTQEIAWFDQEKNSIGALSARLSGDAADVNGAIGFPLSGMIQAFSNIAVSVIVAFYYSWKLTLLCLASYPFIIGSVMLEAKFMAAAAVEEKELLEHAATIATEAITNIRTVAGLRREADIITEYNKEITNVETRIKKKLRYRGIVNSCGMTFPFFAYAAALCYGGFLIAENDIPFQDAVKVSEILLYGAMILGQALAFAPAFTASLVAARRLFNLIDRVPKIQSSHTAKANSKDVGHNVTFSNIFFRYPKRPEAAILQGLRLEIPEGKTVALVGPSGSGKSTCIQLLQRLYQCDHGAITIGQNDIYKDLTLSGLRQKLGIVSQEPVLFERTIAENIAYGDNTRDVSLVEIMDCAKMANIHNFVSSLPLGYETRLGSKGTQLSGGEKQRIAIARALVRNPKILLLDEATSALDLQSEKIVQAALEFACSGRTCIVIAHRLSTVQNADLICVVHNGKIAEKGTHSQLLAQGGIYARLYQSQPQIQ